MFVMATAGHVDHGKSTLVRALTGMEPDRWAQERARGMTIDLGYAWTTLPEGQTVAFVDVPGHERFIGNMLAGIGPAPAVLMVVSADEGWRAQSAEHLAAIDALGIRHGLLAITRSDLADPAGATRQALQHLSTTSLESVRAVAVSAVTGAGLAELRAALAAVTRELPAPVLDGRVRLWVDRAFTIRGAGTVVTGTLAAGTLTTGDILEFAGRSVRVRGLQTLGRSADRVEAVARVAINLKGAELQGLHRGIALVTPGAWKPAALVDARCTHETKALPAQAVLHLGTGTFPVRIRPLGDRIIRLMLPVPVPLQPGDRGILRNPGLGRFEGAVEILDVDPPVLRRRGAAARRGGELAALEGLPALVDQVNQRGVVRIDELTRVGVDLGDHMKMPDSGVRREGDWLISAKHWTNWSQQLRLVLAQHDRDQPLQPGMTFQAARHAVDVPDNQLLRVLAGECGLFAVGGRIESPGSAASLGAAASGVGRAEKMLRNNPFGAPERSDLAAWGLGRQELAAAERAGRLLRLTDDLVLLPSAPALAMELLATLPAPFSASAARTVWGTTRRVAIPLLEHLDRRGWTRQVDAGLRILSSRPTAQN